MIIQLGLMKASTECFFLYHVSCQGEIGVLIETPLRKLARTRPINHTHNCVVPAIGIQATFLGPIALTTAPSKYLEYNWLPFVSLPFELKALSENHARSFLGQDDLVPKKVSHGIIRSICLNSRLSAWRVLAHWSGQLLSMPHQLLSISCTSINVRQLSWIISDLSSRFQIDQWMRKWVYFTVVQDHLID